MSYYLGLETSTATSSIAIFEDNRVIINKEISLKNKPNQYLFSLIENALNYAELETKTLKTLFLSSGPGSYTGLRIGTAAAKGICFGSNIPLISVNTLELMACQVYQSIKNIPLSQPYLLMPVLDARKNMIYVACYDSIFLPVLETQLFDLKDNIFKKLPSNHTILAFGNGAEKCKTYYQDKQIRIIENIYPQAKYLQIIGLEKYQKEYFVDLAYFEPSYLKGFIPTKRKPKL